jgi:sulfide dehydrogenase [flavocytochrome c] flavoprotein subunit
MRRRTFLGLGLAAVGASAAASRASNSRRGSPRVIVAGGGFAGASCALELRVLAPTLEIVLVDPEPRYVTCPMSNSVIAGLRDLGSITIPRIGLARRGIRVVRDTVAAVDPTRRRVRLGAGASLTYDRLVVAPGIRFLWGQPEGYTEAAATRMPHAWQAGEQTELLARQLSSMRRGGVLAISVPAGPMRCPPGPFERASLIAAYLIRHNPRGKVLIFDANNHFPRQDVFTDAWQTLYPGSIEWIPVVEGGAVQRVDPERMALYTAHGEQRADVINVIPAQAPGMLAAGAGLAAEHGWCPVHPATFESTLVPGVHVIGDACIADPMPKSGSAAHAQARRCAAAVAAALTGQAVPNVRLESVCYSLLAADRGLSIQASFAVDADSIRQLPPSAGPSADPRSEADNAARWYRSIVSDSFGV